MGDTQEMSQIINRNRLFYCTHQNNQNRNNGFFRKHVFNTKNISTQDLAEQIFDAKFGFCRIRKSLKENVMKILKHVLVSQKKFDFNYYLQKNAPLPPNWHNRK